MVRAFFQAFGQGKRDEVVALFDANASIYSVRSGEPEEGRPYGTYRGQGGAQAFLEALGTLFDTKDFVFRSEWALRCVIHQGKITEYRFYEDSEAFHLAAS